MRTTASLNDTKGAFLMKIVVLKSSGNTHGSSNLLADEFIRGARESGHNVTEIDTFRINVSPCTGCVACGYEGTCAQSDDMETVRSTVLAGDMIVFVTPLYYYGMSAQLKIVVDRFCAYNSSLNSRHLKSALLTVAWNADNWTFDALDSHFKTFVRYIEMENVGTVYGFGCDAPETTAASDYSKQAYELGKNL